MFICVCVPVCLLEETLVVRFGYFFFLLLIYISWSRRSPACAGDFVFNRPCVGHSV